MKNEPTMPTHEMTPIFQAVKRFQLTFTALRGREYKVEIDGAVLTVTSNNNLLVTGDEDSCITFIRGQLRRNVRIAGPCHFNSRIVACLWRGDYDWHVTSRADHVTYRGPKHTQATCNMCTQFHSVLDVEMADAAEKRLDLLLN